MKKNTIFMLLLAIFLTVHYVSPSSAFFASDVKKAREFMKAGMFPQAIKLTPYRAGF